MYWSGPIFPVLEFWFFLKFGFLPTLLGWPSHDDFLSIVSNLSPSLSISFMITSSFCSNAEGSSLKVVLSDLA